MSETRLWPSGGQIAWADGKWSLETSRSEHVDEIERLRKELGMAEPAPYRFTNKPAPAESLNFIAALAGERWRSGLAEPTRSPGVDEDTARHEAGHAVVAHGLGWHVVYVDAIRGETKWEAPEYWEQSLADRYRQHDAIAAAGSVAAGTSSFREENLNDRVAVRSKGGDFKEARKLAEKLLADRWAKPALERLTRALIMVGGRLEGDALRAVLEG